MLNTDGGGVPSGCGSVPFADHADLLPFAFPHPPHPKMPFTPEKGAIWNTLGLFNFSFEEKKGPLSCGVVTGPHGPLECLPMREELQGFNGSSSSWAVSNAQNPGLTKIMHSRSFHWTPDVCPLLLVIKR